VVKCKKDKQNL